MTKVAYTKTGDRLLGRGEIRLMRSINEQLNALAQLQPEFKALAVQFHNARAAYINAKQSAEVIKPIE